MPTHDSLSVSSSNNRYQRHQQEAKRLLQAYVDGDSDTVDLFQKFLPDAKRSDFQPTLQDARFIVSRQSLKVNRLNLQKLRKDAKDLLKQLKAGQVEELVRLRTYHPLADTINIDSCKLADAQLIVARELGLASWPKLKQHIEAMDSAAQTLDTEGCKLDQDLTTLHIRCGSDLKDVLPACGLSGDFLEISNPFPQGQVPPSEPLDYFLDCRASFIKSSYAGYVPEDRLEQSRAEFAREEQSLRGLPGQYQRIVLWFEHDAFDQLCFAYILHHLAQADLNGVSVELIQIDRFPGVNRFIGLGQLSQQPQSLQLLWQQRSVVNAKEFSFGCRVWQAFTGADPLALWQLSNDRNNVLPLMQTAVKRMLLELPWITDGLSLTERLALSIVKQDGSITRQRLFHFLLSEAEPQPFLGDIMFYSVLDGLSQAKQPALTISMDNQGEEKYSLTNVGDQLLANCLNWVDLAPLQRWMGGQEIKPGAKNWYWNPEVNRPEYQ